MGLDLSRIDVMAVNPSRALHQILKQVLWDVGLRQLRSVTAGGGAFREMADRPADLMFVDFALADGPGATFVRRLRRSPDSPAPFCAVIMTVADPTLEKTFAARDSGADEVVTRPVTVNGVLQKLAAVFERPRGMVLAPTYIGPDRRRAAAMNLAGGERRNPSRRDVFEVAPMPLLQMKRQGEHAAAERLVTEARHVLRDLRMAWIDGDLDGLVELLATASSGSDIAALRPLLVARLEAAVRTMEEHGYPSGARIAEQLIRLLGHGERSERTAQLLKVNIDSLRAVIRSRPGASDELAREIVRGLQVLTGEARDPVRQGSRGG